MNGHVKFLSGLLGTKPKNFGTDQMHNCELLVNDSRLNMKTNLNNYKARSLFQEISQQKSMKESTFSVTKSRELCLTGQSFVES